MVGTDVITDIEQIADEFNTYFKSVFGERGSAGNPIELPDLPPPPAFEMPKKPVVSVEEIFSLLVNINEKISPRGDYTPNTLWRRSPSF